MPHMNAHDRIFMNSVRNRTAAQILAGAFAMAILSGCASGPIASAKVEPKSPVAADVAKQASADKDYPSFNEIPAAPTDVRPARVYGDRAKALEAARADLDRQTAPDTWTLGDSSAFAARARSDAGPDLGPATNTDTEAFAAAVRRRATPPPPAQH